VFPNGERGFLSKRPVEGGECEQRFGKLGVFIENMMRGAGRGFTERKASNGGKICLMLAMHGRSDAEDTMQGIMPLRGAGRELVVSAESKCRLGRDQRIELDLCLTTSIKAMPPTCQLQ
jgi:hypothetical protein